MGELVSPPIIAFGGGSCCPGALTDSVERLGIIDICTASGLPVHVIALRMSPAGVFNRLPQIIVSSSPGAAKS